MNYTFLFSLPICLLCLCSSISSHGQSILAADGGEGGTERIRIEWTLGEFAISTLATPSGWLTEGFHQPHLQVVRVPPALVNSAATAQPGLQVTIAPNPVQDILNIQLQKQVLSLQLRLLDANGRLLLRQPVLAPNHLQINLSKYPSGLYMLQFLREDGTSLETFKVSKH